MRKKLLAGLAAGVAMLGLSGVANANVITFDDYSPLNNQAINPLITHGFEFLGTFPGVFNEDAGAYNGTPQLIFAFWDIPVLTFSKAGGGSFTLNSFELGLSWYHPVTSVNATITSTLLDGSALSIDVNLNDTFQTINIGLNDVRSVSIYSNGYQAYFAMDNLDVNAGDPVPEPATMLLFGTGIAGLVGSRIKRKNSK